MNVRELREAHLDDVVRIDASHTGTPEPEYWSGVFERFLRSPGAERCIGLIAEDGGSVVGYLLGEVRAFEFGSEPCGWIFGIGVEPSRLRGGVAGRLLAEARRRFRTVGVTTLRTMVRRNDVPVLTFFRSHGFVGGSFTQLESDVGGPQ